MHLFIPLVGVHFKMYKKGIFKKNEEKNKS